MNHWAVREEISHRCALLSQHGYIPPEVLPCTLAALRIRTRIPALLVSYAPFSPWRVMCPPSDVPMDETFMRGVLDEVCSKDSVKQEFAALRDDYRVALQRLLEDVRTRCIAFDLFWAVVLRRALTVESRGASAGANAAWASMSAEHLPRRPATAVCTRPTNAAPSVAGRGLVTANHSPSRHEIIRDIKTSERYASLRQALHEIFAALCPPDAETISSHEVGFLMSKLGLGVTSSQMDIVIEDILGDTFDIRNANRSLRMCSKSVTSSRTTAGVSPAPSATQNSFAAEYSHTFMTEESALLGSFATGEPLLNKSNVLPTSTPRVSKSQFVEWLLIANVEDFSHSFLKTDAASYAKRAAQQFKTLMSPFVMSLPARDAVALPYCRVVALIVMSWLRAFVAVDVEGSVRELSNGELTSQTQESEWIVTETLLGLGLHISPAAEKMDRTVKIKGFSAKPAAVATNHVLSLHPKPPAVAAAASQQRSGATVTAADVMAGLSKFTKAARFGAVAVLPNQSPRRQHAATTGAARIDEPADNDTCGREAHRAVSQRGCQQPPSPERRYSYASLQTMLTVIDDEVRRERTKGSEANIVRAAKYITAQQYVSVTGVTTAIRQAAAASAFNAGITSNRGTSSDGRSSATTTTLLDEMLMEEARPQCVRVARSHSSGKRSSIFNGTVPGAMTPSERLAIVAELNERVLERFETTMAGQVARRRTAPVSDIASATSQRTIAKHTRRLVQHVEDSKFRAEKTLERRCAELTKFASALHEERGQVNSNPEDAAIYRQQLTDLHQAFQDVLSSPDVTLLCSEARNSAISSAVTVGKRLRAVMRHRDRRLHSVDAALDPNLPQVDVSDDG